MNIRETAAWAYRQVTRRDRRRLLSRLRSHHQLPIAILFYHRVADAAPNPWTIRKDDFRRHLDWLQTNFDVVSLEEAQRRIRCSESDRPTVSITFDDGYSDNSDFALPELNRRGLPATYFVTTGFVANGRPFPHDVERGQPLLPNSLAELKAYKEWGIEIGAHTRNHVDVGSLGTEAELRSELLGSLEDLNQWLDQKTRYFAFPYGFPENMSGAAVALLREYGIQGFCSAYGALNWPGDEGLHLRRFHAAPGLERLKNWLTFDRRKLEDRTKLPFAERENATHTNIALSS